MSVQGRELRLKMKAEIRRMSERGLNISQIARALGLSRSTVRKYLKNGLEETGVKSITPYSAPWAADVDWDHVFSEMSRGVQLAHYFEQNCTDIETNYVSFWREFKRRFPSLPIDLHRHHPAGERCEYDFKGADPGFGYVDKDTGEFIGCRLFGNILCFSQLLFIRASHTEKQDDLFDSLSRSFTYFGGTPKLTVFDNAKAQVTRADRYDADLNPEFSYFCEVYNTAPIAARPRKPKDKNLIEGALGVFWRWAKPQIMRNTHFSLTELNREIKSLVDQFNQRVQRKYGQSRRDRFNQFEKSELCPLPETPYNRGSWKKLKPHPDCHIQHQYCFYSVPHTCRSKEVDVRVTGNMLEVYQGLERVAVHKLLPSNLKGRYRTDDKHLPESHQAIKEQTPDYVLKESLRIGPETHQIIDRLINEARHPLMYLRRALGIIRLNKKYGKTRLNEASFFFRDASLSDIKIRSLEEVLKANPKPQQRKIVRGPNENLRGQMQWSLNVH